jgi:excisionase family DNA binding protein
MSQELLTTKQLQTILKVDRTTIYRMADSGRIPAIKIGNQWRFPRKQIELWLWKQEEGLTPASSTPAPAPAPTFEPDIAITSIFPQECTQAVQDAYAALMGMMLVITDLEGRPITSPSNVIGLFTATDSAPLAHQRCMAHWAAMGEHPRLQPHFTPSHLGLLCARGLIRVGSDIKAMLIAGGIAPEHWPPDDAGIQKIADDLYIDPAIIRAHIHEVHHMPRMLQQERLPYVQRLADTFSMISSERVALIQRLGKIAALANLP